MNGRTISTRPKRSLNQFPSVGGGQSLVNASLESLRRSAHLLVWMQLGMFLEQTQSSRRLASAAHLCLLHQVTRVQTDGPMASALELCSMLPSLEAHHTSLLSVPRNFQSQSTSLTSTQLLAPLSVQASSVPVVEPRLRCHSQLQGSLLVAVSAPTLPCHPIRRVQLKVI